MSMATATPPNTDTPLDESSLRARAFINDRMGNAARAAKNWRLFAFAGMAVGLIGVSAAFVGFTSAETETLYVPVDEAGRPTDVRLANTSYTPGERSVSYFLGRFIENIRAIPRDRVQHQSNWTQAYDYATDTGRAELSRRMEEEDVFKTADGKARRVRIESIVQQPDSGYYEVEWVEQTITGQGEQPSKRYRGLFQITFDQPETEDQLAINPLGIYVADFSFNPIR